MRSQPPWTLPVAPDLVLPLLTRAAFWQRNPWFPRSQFMGCAVATPGSTLGFSGKFVAARCQL